MGAVLFIAAAVTACSFPAGEAGLKETAEEEAAEPEAYAPPESLDLGDGTSWTVNHYKVTVPAADREYHFAVLNDLHIIEDSEEILEDRRESAMARRETLFIDADGNRSADMWKKLIPRLNDLSPDAVIIAGDLADFYSRANRDSLREGLSGLRVPYLYLRADHDVGAWNTGLDKDTIKEEEEQLCPYDPILELDYPGFRIVGLNDSTSQMTEAGAGMLGRLLKEGDKPVVLFTHVPLEPLEDSGLTEASKEAWEDRALLWGSRSYYQPDDVTQSCLNEILDEGSPVAAVFAGHLHFRYDGPLSGNIEQHVLDANYKGNISIVTVGP